MRVHQFTLSTTVYNAATCWRNDYSAEGLMLMLQWLWRRKARVFIGENYWVYYKYKTK